MLAKRLNKVFIVLQDKLACHISVILKLLLCECLKIVGIHHYLRLLNSQEMKDFNLQVTSGL